MIQYIHQVLSSDAKSEPLFITICVFYAFTTARTMELVSEKSNAKSLSIKKTGTKAHLTFNEAKDNARLLSE